MTLTRYGAASLPALITVAIMLAGFLPFPVKYVGVFMPHIGLIAVYFWSIFKPKLLPNTIICLLALLYDALAMLPLGMHMLLWLGVRWVLITKRRTLIQQHFWLVWAGFAVTTLASTFMWWIMMMAYQPGLVEFSDLMGGMLSTVAIYPLLHRLYGQLHIYYQRKARY